MPKQCTAKKKIQMKNENNNEKKNYFFKRLNCTTFFRNDLRFFKTHWLFRFEVMGIITYFIT